MGGAIFILVTFEVNNYLSNFILLILTTSMLTWMNNYWSKKYLSDFILFNLNNIIKWIQINNYLWVVLYFPLILIEVKIFKWFPSLSFNNVNLNE